MKVFYRISDKSYEKQKLMGATKEVCLKNFMSVFSGHNITIIADRCTQETLEMVKSYTSSVVPTDKGNAGSFNHALLLGMSQADDELVYFCEDDYLHTDKSPVLLQEGIKRADYVTLYDHPDKYTSFYDGGEISKVVKTASSHWRYTASTCMTFASKCKTLKEDRDIWMEFTRDDHPHDHFAFKKLGDKRRRLAVCIPGAACHTDLTFSGRVNHVLMEPWAIQMMIEQRESEIASIDDAEFIQMKEALLRDRHGWEKLVALDALFKKSLLTT